MALIAVAADKGSPGVTTSAVALAAVWPRPVLLAECDPAGGDLVFRLPAAGHGQLDTRRGLLSLAIAARRGLAPGQVWEHVQKVHGGLDVLVGVTSAEQAAGLQALWGSVGNVLASLPEADVIADCGRIGVDGPFYDLIAQASATLLITGASLGEVIRLRERAAAVAAGLQRRGRTGAGIQAVIIAHPRHLGATLGEVAHALGKNSPATVAGGIAHDPKSAESLSGEWGGKLDKSMLIRTAREIAAELVNRLPAIAGPGPGAPPPGSGPMPAVSAPADRPRAGRALPSPPPGVSALAGPPSVIPPAAIPRPVSPASGGRGPVGPASLGPGSADRGSAGERSTGLEAIGLAPADLVSGGRELAGQDPVGWPQPAPDSSRRAARVSSGHIAPSDHLGLAAGEPAAGESASAATQLPSHVTQPNVIPPERRAPGPRQPSPASPSLSSPDSPQSYPRQTAAGSPHVAPVDLGRPGPGRSYPSTPDLGQPEPGRSYAGPSDASPPGLGSAELSLADRSAPAPRGRHAEPAQAPEALAPQAQFPKPEFPETRLAASRFPETRYAETQYPEAQYPDAEREDRDASWPSDLAPAAGAAEPAGEW